jgi:hypothetical protein
LDGNSVDWLLITTMTGVLVFLGTATMVFCNVWRKKPALLKKTRNASVVDTTLNWNLILTVITHCTSLAGGVFIAMNVGVFLLTGLWHIDPRAIGLLLVAFVVVMLKSFDSFWTRLFIVQRFPD